MIYVKNLNDKITASGAFDIPLASGSHGHYRTSGTTWGAKVVYSFLKLSQNVKTAQRVHYTFGIES
jgi:hypothetical protein